MAKPKTPSSKTKKAKHGTSISTPSSSGKVAGQNSTTTADEMAQPTTPQEEKIVSSETPGQASGVEKAEASTALPSGKKHKASDTPTAAADVETPKSQTSKKKHRLSMDKNKSLDQGAATPKKEEATPKKEHSVKKEKKEKAKPKSAELVESTTRDASTPAVKKESKQGVKPDEEVTIKEEVKITAEDSKKGTEPSPASQNWTEKTPKASKKRRSSTGGEEMEKKTPVTSHKKKLASTEVKSKKVEVPESQNSAKKKKRSSSSGDLAADMASSSQHLRTDSESLETTPMTVKGSEGGPERNRSQKKAEKEPKSSKKPNAPDKGEELTGKVNDSRKKRRSSSEGKLKEETNQSSKEKNRSNSGDEVVEMAIDSPLRDSVGTNTVKNLTKEEKQESKLSDQAFFQPASSAKPDPSVDLVIHRVRHLDFHPKPILCICPTVVGSKNARDTLLAISRANGSVELRSTGQNMRTLATVAGATSKPVNVMSWLCNNTCVGASRDGTIFVVDFSMGRIQKVTPSAGGGIFALASLCRRCKKCPGVVAAGCEDGAIRFFEVSDAKMLHVVSTIPSSGAAVLSLIWTRFVAETKGFEGSTVFAGVADGTIRRFDYLGGTWKSTLRMTVECLGRNTPTRVWSLRAMSDGTVVSGDSLGHVQFWDGHAGTLIASFDQNANKADVLCLDVTQDQSKVFASGIDSRVVCIERSKDSTAKDAPQKWILTHAQRPHTHDVQAMALYTSHKNKKDVLCTGGIDTKLCIYTVSEFQKWRPRTRYPWPCRTLISIAAEVRILTMMRENRVDLYALAPRPASTITEAIPIDEKDALIGTVEIQSPFNLLASDISMDGRFLAVTNASALLLFRLQYQGSGSSRNVTPSQLSLKLPENTCVLAIKFTARNRLLLGCSTGEILVIAMADGNAKCELVQTIAPIVSADNKTVFSLPIDVIVASSDGDWFVTSRNSIMQKDPVQVFRYDERTDKYHLWWVVPELDVPHSAVSFLPGKEPNLVVACVNYASYVFNLVDKALCTWSKAAGYPVSKALPSPLNTRTDFPARIGINPGNPKQFFMGSFGAMVAIDTSRRFPNACRLFPEGHVRNHKRKRSISVASAASEGQDGSSAVGQDESCCTLCLRYNSMLYMDCIGENEMVIVEQPWLSVVATFPDALQRRVYGS